MFNKRQIRDFNNVGMSQSLMSYMNIFVLNNIIKLILENLRENQRSRGHRLLEPSPINLLDRRSYIQHLLEENFISQPWSESWETERRFKLRFGIKRIFGTKKSCFSKLPIPLISRDVPSAVETKDGKDFLEKFEREQELGVM